MPKKPAKRVRDAPASENRGVPKDIAILRGPTDDGQGMQVVRLKDGAMFAGEVRPAREGKPLAQEELVRLRPLHPDLPVCEIEVLHGPKTGEHAANADEHAQKPAGTERTSAGPARVSNESFRRNWSHVFGAQPKRKGRRGDWSIN